MKRPATGSTLKQYAYAQNVLTGNGNTKQEAARLAGFSPTVARNPGGKIEKTDGFKNAMMALALKSNNILLKTLHEFDKRDLSQFSNTELIGAVRVITDSWSKIDSQRRESNKNKDPEKNPLRAIYVARATTITEVNPLKKRKRKDIVIEAPQVTDPENKEGLDLDF